MYQGLQKLTDYVMLQGEDEGDDEAQRFGSLCKRRFVAALQPKVSEAKAMAEKRRSDLDTKRAENLPKIPQMNEAAMQALIDLHVLRDTYLESFKKTGTLPRSVRRAINAKAYGVAAYRTFPGRPGEWERMLVSHVEECLKNPEIWYIVVTHHKTIKTSGPLGRYMPADVKMAFMILVEFMVEDRGLLFNPSRGKTSKVQLAQLAGHFAKAHTPGREKPEPTLMRKFAESLPGVPELSEQANRMAKKIGVAKTSGPNMAQKLMGDASGHPGGGRTQLKHYLLNSKNPEVHAKTCKAYIEEFLGPSLVLPGKKDPRWRSAKQIMSEFIFLNSKKVWWN